MPPAKGRTSQIQSNTATPGNMKKTKAKNIPAKKISARFFFMRKEADPAPGRIFWSSFPRQTGTGGRRGRTRAPCLPAGICCSVPAIVVAMIALVGDSMIKIIPLQGDNYEK
jgi:hypothetical protein